MASIFKKALGVFVEFEEEQTADSAVATPVVAQGTPKITPTATPTAFNQQDVEKFSKHFDALFEKSNLAGPDYFEFFKMMDTLEAHIADEKTRISAVFASLSIQGLTKQKLIETASHYKQVIQADKDQFEKAIDKKAESELETRKQNLITLEKRIFDHSELIKNLTKEITEAQGKIGILKEEIQQEEAKLGSNKGGYNLACEAILNKINTDIVKINNSI